MNVANEIADLTERFVTGLESISAEFSRIASTPEQQRLAEKLTDLTALVSPSVIAKALKPAIEKAYQASRGPDIDLDR